MKVLAQEIGERFALFNGDSNEVLAGLPDASVDLSVYSPPFLSLYTYSPSERDIGNCQTDEEFWEHFSYVIRHNLRVTKPGRICAVHCADVPAMLSRDGYIGLKDFPGQTIRAFVDAGWIYHGRVTIDKNVQAQAERTHAKGLMFGEVEKDAAWARMGLSDYIVVFRKPGENAVRIKPEMTRQEWILWARPVWYAADYLPGTWRPDGGSRKSGEPAKELGIREGDTLNYRAARGNDDERHIAPLQLATIERCVRLWSNAGETVLSPFAGIGSEGYVSLQHGRRFVGVELKPEYFAVAARNLREAEAASKAGDLFSAAGMTV